MQNEKRGRRNHSPRPPNGSVCYSISNFFLRSFIPSTTAFALCVPIASAHLPISSISWGDSRKPIFSVLGFVVGLPIFFSPIATPSLAGYAGKHSFSRRGGGKYRPFLRLYCVHFSRRASTFFLASSRFSESFRIARILRV